MRDHEPIVLEEFNGLWKRGGQDSVPLDHFTDCNNLEFTESGFKVRRGIEPYQNYGDVLKIKIWSQSLLILDTNGNIYHTDRASPHTPILSLPGMIDFGFVQLGSHGYISPRGIADDFIYVYIYGDTNPARKAAGDAPTTAPTLNNTAGGNVEEGIHIFAVVYETNTGFLTSLSPGAQITAPGDEYVELIDIPISGDDFVVARHIVATRAIDPDTFTGNLTGYQFFFVPDGRIGDNTTTTLTVDFFDADLLADASHLLDLFSSLRNCTGLGLYHGRLIAWAPLNSIGLPLNSTTVYVSFPGEPEAISQVDGFFLLPPDGTPITYCQPYRDILYVFKETKTLAVTDNGGSPSSWSAMIVDGGIGAGSPNAVATILDVSGASIDFILVAHYAGISRFDGTYVYPELTWKIADIWPGQDRNAFFNLQLLVNTVDHQILVVLPDGTMLMGDYKNGFDFKSIRWSPWTFNLFVTSAAVIQEIGVTTLISMRSTD